MTEHICRINNTTKQVRTYTDERGVPSVDQKTIGVASTTDITTGDAEEALDSAYLITAIQQQQGAHGDFTVLMSSENINNTLLSNVETSIDAFKQALSTYQRTNAQGVSTPVAPGAGNAVLAKAKADRVVCECLPKFLEVVTQVNSNARQYFNKTLPKCPPKHENAPAM